MSPETIFKFIEPHIESKEDRIELIHLLSEEIKPEPKRMTQEQEFEAELRKRLERLFNRKKDSRK